MAKLASNTEAPLTSHLPALGLRTHALSPTETLAQSISTIAPSVSPLLTIPLVFALAGAGTWLAYLLAMVCMGLIACCIAIFARDSASPGSLYAYTRASLPPVFGMVSAWSLLFAYVFTAASMVGGVLDYGFNLLGGYGRHLSPVLVAVALTAAVVWTASRGIKLSTQTMFWVEGITIGLVVLVLGAVLRHGGAHLDGAQTHLHRAALPGLRLAVILAIFSFVGFESATALGAEAREPLRTIPRAVIGSALLAGAFFIGCSYAEVLGFAHVGHGLNEEAAPVRVLAAAVHLGALGPAIDVGVLISMFACMLACVIAAARVLLLMAHHGLAHRQLRRTHAQHETPWMAGLVVGVLAVLPPAILAVRGASGADIFGWMGSLAVYGFLTAYGLVTLALPVYLRRRGRLGVGSMLLSVAASGAAVIAMLGSVLPVPPPPFRYLPYLYLAYLLLGLGWYGVSARHRMVPVRSAEGPSAALAE